MKNELEEILVLFALIAKSGHKKFCCDVIKRKKKKQTKILKLEMLLKEHGKVATRFFFSPSRLTNFLSNLKKHKVHKFLEKTKKFEIPDRVFLCMSENQLKFLHGIKNSKNFNSRDFQDRFIRIEGIVKALSQVFLKQKVKIGGKNQNNFILVSKKKTISQRKESLLFDKKTPFSNYHQEQYQEAIIEVSRTFYKLYSMEFFRDLKVKLFSNFISSVSIGKYITAWGILSFSCSSFSQKSNSNKFHPELKVYLMKFDGNRPVKTLNLEATFYCATSLHDIKIRGEDRFFWSYIVSKLFNGFIPFFGFSLIIFLTFFGFWNKKINYIGHSNLKLLFSSDSKIQLKKLIKIITSHLFLRKKIDIYPLDLNKTIINDASKNSRKNNQKKKLTREQNFLNSAILLENKLISFEPRFLKEVQKKFSKIGNKFQPQTYLIYEKISKRLKSNYFNGEENSPDKPFFSRFHLKHTLEIDYVFHKNIFWGKYEKNSKDSSDNTKSPFFKKEFKYFSDQYKKFKIKNFLFMDSGLFFYFMGNFKHPNITDEALKTLTNVYVKKMETENCGLPKVFFLEKVVKLSISHTKCFYQDFVRTYDCLVSLLLHTVYIKSSKAMFNHFLFFSASNKSFLKSCKRCKNYKSNFNFSQNKEDYSFTQSSKLNQLFL
mmetsp:Transcript_19381/g.30326  ORF Transcript_19381/g.30326 Transcript_19381/m.30326 type:complete len:658 (-) Transcript_19381:770-2743(-)